MFQLYGNNQNVAKSPKSIYQKGDCFIIVVGGKEKEETKDELTPQGQGSQKSPRSSMSDSELMRQKMVELQKNLRLEDMSTEEIEEQSLVIDYWVDEI